MLQTAAGDGHGPGLTIAQNSQEAAKVAGENSRTPTVWLYLNGIHSLVFVRALGCAAEDKVQDGEAPGTRKPEWTAYCFTNSSSGTQPAPELQVPCGQTSNS